MNTSTLETVSPTDLLRSDHSRVKDLFREFDSADFETRKSVAREAVRLLQNHDVVEQKLFYPACREISDKAEGLVLRAEEAHHAMNVLITELLVLPYSDRYFAKFHTLQQAVLAHIREEENEIFPVVERSGQDLDELGRDMISLKNSLESRGMAYRAARGAGTGTLIGVGLAAAVGYGLYALFSRD
ncbi:MAG TPA: hemerythrin domain-containing protein [Elusimicrobiota bacterium]|nr:hemerythrin domain-containing protein [Elusimicrobiota bacterium]